MNSLRRSRSFTFVEGNTANNPNISVSLKTTDMKNSISFTLDILAPSSYRTISNLNINFESYPLVAIRAREDYNGYNGYIVEDYNVSNGSYSGSSQKELKFPFENLNVHKFEYTVEVADTQGNYGKYIYIYNFIYFTVPVTLSDFAFDTNTLQTGDKIQITGLSLNHHSNLNSNGNIVDTTFPESVDNSGEIIPNAQGLYILDEESIVDVDGVVSNRSYAPFVKPALKFTFQKVSVVSPDLPSSEVNNDINALYDPQVLHFNLDLDGNYTLPANTLDTNAVYAVKVQALWADGFYGTKVATQNINIIGRPVIEYVTTLPLYVKNNDDPAVTIGVSGDVGNKVWFNFYNESNALVAKAGGENGIDIISGEEINEYSLSLNQIIKTNSSNGLLNGVQYSVKVETKYGAIVRLSHAEYVTFALVNPSIDTVTTYDIQQDGGNDGVGDDASNQDASNQIVATIMVNTTEYELYAPEEVDGIKFYIYDEHDVKVASTSSYTFLNDDNEDTNLYNIRLNEITLEGNSLTLTNGTEYSIKAEVTLLNHNGETETRLSDAYTNVVFNQDVAPIADLTVSNTWELATNYNPSSEIDHFNNSPLIGISGHFKKTAQFDASNYPKQLDTASTKFKLEYKLNGGNSWSLVTKAVLAQKSSSENIKVAVNRVKGLTLVSSVDGLYDNVVGTILGTSQEPLVFYIPQNQGNGNAFDETNSVIIRVTVVDEASLWAGVNEATTDSSSVQLINKINSYSYTNGESSEPWNSKNEAQALVLNIPVNWNTTHAHSLKLGYKYSLGASYSYLTYNYGDVQVDTMGNKYVSLTVDPSLGTILYYSVAYIVNNTNLPSAPLTTQGLTIDVNVPNKNFPVSSSYAVADDTFKTFNNDGQSSITFTLTQQLSSEDRLDGINVYFSSTSVQNNGTAIPLTRIQSYLLSNIDGTSKTITLMNSSGGTLNIMGNTGNIVSVPALYWKDYSQATISFKGFRDRRVNTAVTNITFPYNSLEYTESGSKQFADSILNTPIIDSPSGGGGDGGGEVANPITLHGGVINSANPSTDTFIEWQASNDTNGNPFKYDFKLIKNNDSTPLEHDENVTGTSKVLSIDTVTTAKYKVEIRKVFQVGSVRELSPPIVIEFYSIKVDVSGMNVAITRPSNNQLVNLSWNEPAFTGSSITTDGSSASSSFANNINTFRMVYTTTNTAVPVTLNHLKSGNNLIERITSPATSYQYDLPNQNLATLYSFFMQVKAQVAYTVDSSLSSSKSVPVLISYLSSTVTSQYRVSTIPVINPLPSNTPVLTNVSSNPTLLLDLDARGLENEGFISVVCILTQDGTDTKPGGSSAMVVFPAPPSSPNYLPDASGNVLGNNGSILENAGSSSDVRLVSGQGYESTPVNVNNSTISITNSAYKLTIGSPSTNYGRYGYSTLEMPLSVNSGFQNSGNPSDAAYNPVNYMIIVTTRRGTDYNVGTFTYAAPPAVSNVNVVNTNGTYYVNFNISPA
jgi:hypothetical protein